MFINHFTTIDQILSNLSNFLEAGQYIDGNRSITKTVTLVSTFHKLAGEANPYVWFGHGPLTIFNNTRGQFSVLMNADPINRIHTNQKSAKEGLNKELVGYFISNKENN